MRISYSDVEDYPGQFNLFQANCERSIKGKRGQQSLRELEAALLAMPEKRLIRGALQDQEGEVCAIGALVKHRGVTLVNDPEEMEAVGVELGFPWMVAWKVVELNDIDADYKYDAASGKIVDVTPEERYSIVLKWVQKKLHESQ